jgi:hypothetical protein
VLEDFGAKTSAVAELEVHALEHRRPVLRLRAAGARLDVEEAVVRIERVGEHAAELHRRNVLFDLCSLFPYFLEGGVVVVGLRQAEELGGIGEPAADAAEGADDRLERLLFLAELLRALLVAPDLRIAQLALDFGQPSLLALEVKDTSAAPPTATAGR